MRIFPLLASLWLLPLPVLAQSAYSNAPMVVYGGENNGGSPASAPEAPTNASPANVTPATPAAIAVGAIRDVRAAVINPAVTAAPLNIRKTNDPAAAMLANFPAQAITNVGEKSGGEYVNTPAAPPNPATPAGVATAGAPVTPASPLAPDSPVNKLWPRDTFEIFMPACVGFHPVQLTKPCSCVISQLVTTMPHNEFLAESEAGTIEGDPRLVNARQACVMTPTRKD